MASAASVQHSPLPTFLPRFSFANATTRWLTSGTTGTAATSHSSSGTVAFHTTFFSSTRAASRTVRPAVRAQATLRIAWWGEPLGARAASAGVNTAPRFSGNSLASVSTDASSVTLPAPPSAAGASASRSRTIAATCSNGLPCAVTITARFV